jgi:negative regulator of replication initiation
MELSPSWQGSCLKVVVPPVDTPNSLSFIMKEALINAHTSASQRAISDGWTAVFDINDHLHIATPESIQQIKTLFSFEEWAARRGCIALAVVIPEHLFEDAYSIYELSQCMNFKARVFFAADDAMTWSLEMQQYSRRQKLH